MGWGCVGKVVVMVVMSHETNACFLFALHACLRTTHAYPRWCLCDYVNAKDADMKKALLSSNVTTKVLAK